MDLKKDLKPHHCIFRPTVRSTCFLSGDPIWEQLLQGSLCLGKICKTMVSFSLVPELIFTIPLTFHFNTLPLHLQPQLAKLMVHVTYLVILPRLSSLKGEATGHDVLPKSRLILLSITVAAGQGIKRLSLLQILQDSIYMSCQEPFLL